MAMTYIRMEIVLCALARRLVFERLYDFHLMYITRDILKV